MMPTCRIPPPKSLRSRRAAANRLGRARQRRADRRTEPLGKTDRDRVEVLSPSRAPDARGDDGVHQPRAVEVHGQVVLAAQRRSPRCSRSGGRGRRRDCGCSPGRPAGSGRNGRRARPDGVAQVVERRESRRRPRTSAPSRPRAGRSRRLPRRRRATSTRTSSSSPGCVFTPTAIWLAIVPDGTNSAASLPSSSAVLRLEQLDGRVVAEDVVADLRLGHRPPHRRGRLGDGVGTQVDRRHVHRGIAHVTRPRWIMVDTASAKGEAFVVSMSDSSGSGPRRSIRLGQTPPLCRQSPLDYARKCGHRPLHARPVHRPLRAAVPRSRGVLPDGLSLAGGMRPRPGSKPGSSSSSTSEVDPYLEVAAIQRAGLPGGGAGPACSAGSRGRRSRSWATCSARSSGPSSSSATRSRRCAGWSS